MDEDDPVRLQIREKISNMSFEELAKLKAELGGQAYNEAIFGVKKKPCVEKRINKNRPAEMSSKIRPDLIAKTRSSLPRRPEARDPRFDYLCGEFDAKKFKQDYEFIKSIKSREKEELKKQLRNESREKEREKIKFLITRMENQERSEKKMEEEREKNRKEAEERIQMLQEGKKPHFVKKSEKRLLDLVEHYEELKKKGKVDKAIAKYRQKKKAQHRKALF